MGRIGFEVVGIREPVDIVASVRSYPAVAVFAEIKNPEQSPSRRRLKLSQMKFYSIWPGYFTVLQTIHDCKLLLQAIRAGTAGSTCHSQMHSYFKQCYGGVPLDLITGGKHAYWHNWILENGGARVVKGV